MVDTISGTCSLGFLPTSAHGIVLCTAEAEPKRDSSKTRVWWLTPGTNVVLAKGISQTWSRNLPAVKRKEREQLFLPCRESNQAKQSLCQWWELQDRGVGNRAGF